MLTTSVSLSEFLPNPKGSGGQEWAELANSSDVAVDLSGWAIDDADGGGSPYRLPEGSSIAPHGLLVVLLSKALFNNSGDTVRLLRPDGGVADQYAYAQSDSDQSFCRAESEWSLCAPSPNAPNRAAVLAPLATDASVAGPQTSGVAISQAPILSQASLGSDSLPQSWAREGLQHAITAAPSYANATSGASYHGVAHITPSLSLSTPTAAPTALGEDTPPIVRPAALPLSMGAGIFLFLAGSMISGYDWLHSRRIALPPELIEAELIDQLEDGRDLP
jgi:hypothetical protein